MCVKMFAPPHLAAKMHKRPFFSMRGHITGVAFKKTEILASYSGDGIYLYDINETKECSIKPSKRKSSQESEDSDSEDGEEETKEKVKKEVKQSDPLAVSTEENENLEKDIEDNKDEDKEVKEEKEKEEKDKEEKQDEEESSDTSETEEWVEADAMSPHYKQTYVGHCNIRTVKEVNFFGPNSDYVISGSDDGRIFIWEKNTRKLVQLLKGDRHVVNCVQGHPFDCVLATSGIEDNVKIWEPESFSVTPLADAPKVTEKNKKRLQESSSGQRSIPLSVFRALMRTLADEETGTHGEIECHTQ